MTQRFLLVIAMTLATGAAWAYPTLLGQTGTGLQPDAAVTHGIELAADALHTQDVFGGELCPVRALVGLGPNAEVGAGYLYVGEEHGWNVHGKVSLPLGRSGARIALGADHSDLADGFVTLTQTYLVGDVPLGRETKISVGAKWSQLAGFFQADGIRYFLGLQAHLSDKWTFTGDLQTRLEAFLQEDMLYSTTVRYTVNPLISVQVGYSDSYLNTIGDQQDAFFFGGINFTLGN